MKIGLQVFFYTLLSLYNCFYIDMPKQFYLKISTRLVQFKLSLCPANKMPKIWVFISVGWKSFFWTNEYPNIFGRIKGSQMRIQMSLPMKGSTNNLANEYVSPKYLNIFKYQNTCRILLWTYLVIVQFCLEKINEY